MSARDPVLWGVGAENSAVGAKHCHSRFRSSPGPGDARCPVSLMLRHPLESEWNVMDWGV